MNLGTGRVVPLTRIRPFGHVPRLLESAEIIDFVFLL